MNVNTEKLYRELRLIRQELTGRLKKGNVNRLVLPLIKEELRDIDNTLSKIESNGFGVCEISGELLPEEMLRIIPTIRNKEDVAVINSFYSKPFH